MPWDILWVDLIGPYMIKCKNMKPLMLHCLMMIDPATSWLEIVQIPNKQPETIVNLVELIWLTRYPHPTNIVLDQGKEFMTKFSCMLYKDYGVKKTPTTIRNPLSVYIKQ